ncbi:hypothetical protein CLV65_0705 [Pseudoscardovia suis]|uniref:Uncharacterized protein n=1 Tax=Pseudoscardovia suis TaxID=987063 RepID=A0A261EWU7_9BIFI|nr:hypothetical protein PSSU_0944 [Pseudoscardovia suis]PJJ68796.1 hypothetical protein CLV65_0705 [Pseudoscardovia suis]
MLFDSASDELGIPQVAIFDDDPYAAIGLSACVQKMLGVAGAVEGDVPIFSRRGRTRVSWKHE